MLLIIVAEEQPHASGMSSVSVQATSEVVSVDVQATSEVVSVGVQMDPLSAGSQAMPGE